MCKVIIDGKIVEFEGSFLTQEALYPYRETASHIVICDSVIEIRDKAFHGFRRLENIEISDSVKVIGESAFWECSVLKALAFPDSITELRDGICMDCKSLENVIIPDSAKAIGSSAFLECRALRSIRVSNSVKYIGRRAFCKCRSLQNIELPASVTKIGDSSFWGCVSLKRISLPDGVTYVGDCVFYGCDTIRLEINGSRKVLTKNALSGYKGQIIFVDIAGDEYPLLTCQNFNKIKTMMVITGYVDYEDRMLYSGYEFNGELDPQNKKPLYCCCKENSYLLYDDTTDGLKRKLDIFGIR